MDPIADFLTVIRNAYLARKDKVAVHNSKPKLALAKLLSDNNYVGKVEVTGVAPKTSLEVELLYKGKLPMITFVKRFSKPSVRRYAAADSLPRALSGRGITVISTSKGLMTDKQARKAGVGGEIICQIW